MYNFNASSRTDVSHLTILRPRPDGMSIASSRMTTDFISSALIIDREKWDNRKEFLFSTLAFTLSLANLWRFPREALLYGNAAFVWLYISFMLVIGGVMVFFEVALGQYSSKGFAKVFNMCPFFEGIKYSMAFYCAIISMVYNMLNVYSVIYFLSSFVPDLPYSVCLEINYNCSVGNISEKYAPEYLFFKDNVLNYITKSPMVVHYTTNWRNIAILFFLWVFIAIAIIRGIRTSRLTSFVICPVPFITLLILMALALFVPGASNGMTNMFTSSLESLSEPETWSRALEQCLVTLGVGMGPLITFGSYSKFHSPANTDCLMICVCSLLCSLLCGLLMFGIIGILAYQVKLPFEDFISDEHIKNLEIHVLFSQLATRLPYGYGHFAALLFYFMFSLVGLHSMLGYTETVVVALYSNQYFSIRYKVHANILVCAVLFVIGSLFALEDGWTVMNMLDYYLIGVALSLIVLFELIAVVYTYGVFEFCDDIEFMIGLYPNTFYQLFWICLPFVFALVLIYHLVLYEYDYLYVICILYIFILGPIVLAAILNTIEFCRYGDVWQVFYPREVIIDYSESDMINSEIASVL